jgi:hypothetical protein
VNYVQFEHTPAILYFIRIIGKPNHSVTALVLPAQEKGRKNKKNIVCVPVPPHQRMPVGHLERLRTVTKYSLQAVVILTSTSLSSFSKTEAFQGSLSFAFRTPTILARIFTCCRSFLFTASVGSALSNEFKTRLTVFNSSPNCSQVFLCSRGFSAIRDFDNRHDPGQAVFP